MKTHKTKTKRRALNSSKYNLWRLSVRTCSGVSVHMCANMLVVQRVKPHINTEQR